MSRIVIEMDEWKYTGGVLYISVYGLEVHSQLQQAKNVHTYDSHSTGMCFGTYIFFIHTFSAYYLNFILFSAFNL